MKTASIWPISPTFFDERSLANNYDASRLPIYSEYWMCRAKKDERSGTAGRPQPQ